MADIIWFLVVLIIIVLVLAYVLPAIIQFLLYLLMFAAIIAVVVVGLYILSKVIPAIGKVIVWGIDTVKFRSEQAKKQAEADERERQEEAARLEWKKERNAYDARIALLKPLALESANLVNEGMKKVQNNFELLSVRADELTTNFSNAINQDKNDLWKSIISKKDNKNQDYQQFVMWSKNSVLSGLTSEKGSLMWGFDNQNDFRYESFHSSGNFYVISNASEQSPSRNPKYINFLKDLDTILKAQSKNYSFLFVGEDQDGLTRESLKILGKTGMPIKEYSGTLKEYCESIKATNNTNFEGKIGDYISENDWEIESHGLDSFLEGVPKYTVLVAFLGEGAAEELKMLESIEDDNSVLPLIFIQEKDKNRLEEKSKVLWNKWKDKTSDLTNYIKLKDRVK